MNLFKYFDNILEARSYNPLLAYNLAYVKMHHKNHDDDVQCDSCHAFFRSDELIPVMYSWASKNNPGKLCKKCFARVAIGKCDVCDTWSDNLYVMVPVLKYVNN